MTDPSTTYEIGRMSVLVERAGADKPCPWLVTASRRQNERFVGASAVAWCDTRESAQDLAQMLTGIETTREGKVIWPDGRIERPEPRDLIRRLVMGADRERARQMDYHGARDWVLWDTLLWNEARRFLRETGEPERDYRECDCFERSWCGDDHDSACPLTGPRGDKSSLAPLPTEEESW